MVSNINIFSLIGILYYTGVFSFVSRVLLGGSGDAQQSDADGNFINQFFGVFIIIGVVYFAFKNKKPAKFEMSVIAPLLLFIIYSLFSVVWSDEPEISARRIFAVLPVVFLAYHLAEKYSAEYIFRVIGLTVGAVAFMGLLLAVFWSDAAFLSGGLRDGAFIGLLTDKNGGARVYMLGIVLLIPSVISRSRSALASVLVCFICLSLTKSVSGVMLLIIAVATMGHFYVFSGRYGKSSNTQLVIVGVVVYFIFVYVANWLYEYLVLLAGRDPTLTDRTVIWDSIIPLVYEKFYFGYGFGAFWISVGADDFVQRWGYIGNAHNGYIEAALNGGVVAVFIIALIIINTIYWLLKLSVIRNHKIVGVQSVGILLTLSYSNFIAYTIPNYRSFDFFIFVLIIFCTGFRSVYLKRKS